MYSQKIKPAVFDELNKAKVASDEYRPEDAFKHLENAHVLGYLAAYQGTFTNAALGNKKQRF